MEYARVIADTLTESVRAHAQVLESPSSSYVWVQLMAFHLGLGDAPQARATAERALRTIHFRQTPTLPLLHGS